jgi:hypothetical protein
MWGVYGRSMRLKNGNATRCPAIQTQQLMWRGSTSGLRHQRLVVRDAWPCGQAPTVVQQEEQCRCRPTMVWCWPRVGFPHVSRDEADVSSAPDVYAQWSLPPKATTVEGIA